MTGFGVDEDVRVDVDLGAAIPCAGMWQQYCPNEPAWRAVKTCCRQSRLFCTPCKTRIEEWYIMAPGLYDAIHCTSCGDLNRDFNPTRFIPV